MILVYSATLLSLSFRFSFFSCFHRYSSCPSVCGPTFYNVRFGHPVYIRTPHYPNSYMIGSDCTWTIQTKPSIGSYKHTFNHTLEHTTVSYKLYVYARRGFDLEPRTNRGCQYDFLRFNNGPSYCGNRTTAIAWILPAQTILRFVSDSTISHKGFEFTISAIREFSKNNLYVR